jgi:hypothetical protein
MPFSKPILLVRLAGRHAVTTQDVAETCNMVGVFVPEVTVAVESA